MGWHNPPVRWAELERRLSDGRRANVPPDADGGDSPAWSRRRQPYEPPDRPKAAPGTGSRPVVPYAELHCHSNFSFLDGASHPEALAEEAAMLGLEAIALTDHDGFYGIVRLAEAAAALDLRTVFGAELSLELSQPQNGRADPEGSHLVVLARDPDGYASLAASISTAQMNGREKGRPVYRFDDLAGAHRDRWAVLTGCRKGAVPAALMDEGPTAAGRELTRLIETFGRHNVFVELWDHGHPLDSARNDALVELAHRFRVDCVATNNVHYAAPTNQQLAGAIAAVRARRSLDDLEGWLPAWGGAHLRSGAEQAQRFRRYPGVVARAAELGRGCAFDIRFVAPELPPFDCPDGLSEMNYLRHLVAQHAAEKFGPPEQPEGRRAHDQLAHELDLIESLGFPGYFLIVWDIVMFCRRENIYCQGRGSAANSAVCYVLGITNVDAVRHQMLFERFLSPERNEPPDIDIDIESSRREEVIQWVYAKHGRQHSAQVANVITYRGRSAVRDMAKALGFPLGAQDAWANQVSAWGGVETAVNDQHTDAGASPGASPRLQGPDRGRGPRWSATTDQAEEKQKHSHEHGGAGSNEPRRSEQRHDIPRSVLDLALQLEHFPRHLGIHSGGMVICDRPVVQVCPVEWARMDNRSVLQWDKDDCARAGLVKFDLLGLGMLSALHGAFDFIHEHHHDPTQLDTLAQDDPEVYDMLCEADTVGVFQVESRAQMGTLPRLRPRTFYDLVIEVALIRPGPIQGGSVHPYIRRRNGTEPVAYPHPALEPVLRKTLGVPLFQEQMMQIAIQVAGFTPAEADLLRQAMGAKRSKERVEQLRDRFYAGIARHGIVGETADLVWDKLAAFANYGFPESHSFSFAHLVYASAWLKRYYPAAFCAALLNAQPMGFYSPHSLVQDARRHGVPVRSPDINASAAKATLEPGDHARAAPAGAGPGAWGVGGPVVRLGISSVRAVGDDLAARLEAGRPYADIEDVARRSGATLPALEALATAGAFGCFGLSRREALWVAGAVGHAGTGRLPGIVTGIVAPKLPAMSRREEAGADLWATGISPDGHPTRFFRRHLDRLGVVAAAELRTLASGSPVQVGGVVTHRQRPATAAGVTFLSLEDETGLVNVVCSKGCGKRFRKLLVSAPALLVKGRLENAEGAVNVVAERLEAFPLGVATRSRDFR